MLTPRYYQDEAVFSLFNYFEHNAGNPVVAMPTGTGKSLVIALFLQRAFAMYPRTRIMMLTHVKELINQNAEELMKCWPTAPLGIYSAGLKQRDVILPIVFGGIASVCKNPEIFGHRDLVIIDECFSPDTEILTETGFIRFDELKEENVAQYDLDNSQISFIKPTAYIRKQATQGLLKVESNKNFNLLVTPGHEMIVNGKKIRADSVTKANYCKMPVAGFGIGLDAYLQSWEKFAICFQADGSIHKQNVNGSSIASFSFSKERKLKAFKDLMTETGFKYKHLDTRGAHLNVKARKRFMVYLPASIDKTIDKYFNLPSMNEIKAKAIIEYMNLWDGHVANKNTYLYTTTNKKMADFYQAIATIAGYRSNLTLVKDVRKETFNDCWRLFITKNISEVTTQSFEPTKIDYSGEVYCVSVPKGNIVTRRNGKVIITGNCHLLSPKTSSMYQIVLATLKLINPQLKIIGLSATPFRLKQGMITDDGLFTDVCYDCTQYDSFNRLIAEGFIAPLISKRTLTQIDVSNVGIVNGEFKQGELEKAVDKDEITYGAVKETCEQGYDRQSWLAFGAGISNVEHIASMFQSFGVSAIAVHSELGDKENDRRIADYKSGIYRCLVNMNKFTTGFNHPPIDLISDLQPTCSPGKHVQKAGRGTRPSPATGKINCLFLDFAGNTRRNGPINDPRIPGRPTGKGGGDVPIRICDCGAYNHAAARFCCNCGMEFIFETKIFRSASEEAILKSDAPIVEHYKITRVLYRLHEKRNQNGTLISPPSMKVSYFCGLQMFNEWICLEHNGLAGKRARDWWRQRHAEEPPATTHEALQRCSELRVPERIRIWANKKFPEVIGYEY